MKRTFMVEDVKRNQRFSALTQGEEATIEELIATCNEEQSLILGVIATRKNVLQTRFDREALMEYISLVPQYDHNNVFFKGLMKNIMEKISRDIVKESMIEDIVKATAIKLEHFNGNVEKVADCIEGYFKGEKIVPMAETWRERAEEVEKGMVIYYETKSIRSI